MPSKLSNECIMYLLESFCSYDSVVMIEPYHRMSIPLICRRYFVQIFNGRDRHRVEIRFERARHTTRENYLHNPLISFFKLVAITPEIEPLPGRDKYVIKVYGEVEYIRPLLKIFFAQYAFGASHAAAAEFNDLVATDFSYPAHRLFGMPYELSSFTSCDPRVSNYIVPIVINMPHKFFT
ncbi:unnamed protein product [Bursaphelenchus xylophilus]|uniref:(pine wood nematode) hypothetical protein n=1 Tax=Bursaphelenchus xylophilus TaxID=6326 RepID=A0A811KYR4_BURXY|nr:unnamed protein product [Bursaphelenchus xylophilus]CAG9105965.1 unnamed protein product [Bursaphelenchus xylophilus]